jgi:hypothetical protein
MDFFLFWGLNRVRSGLLFRQNNYPDVIGDATLALKRDRDNAVLGLSRKFHRLRNDTANPK